MYTAEKAVDGRNTQSMEGEGNADLVLQKGEVEGHAEGLSPLLHCFLKAVLRFGCGAANVRQRRSKPVPQRGAVHEKSFSPFEASRDFDCVSPAASARFENRCKQKCIEPFSANR